MGESPRRDKERAERPARLRREAWASRDICRVVRAFCVECMGGYVEEINRCTAPLCPLYPWRMADSIRRGFDRAAEALDSGGFPDLARESRRKREAGRSAWAERRDTLSTDESHDSQFPLSPDLDKADGEDDS